MECGVDGGKGEGDEGCEGVGGGWRGGGVGGEMENGNSGEIAHVCKLAYKCPFVLAVMLSSHWGCCDVE
jgi:hypothetical protein